MLSQRRTPGVDMAQFFQRMKPDEAIVRRLPANTKRGILKVRL
jgi:hypothetical protein